MFTRSVYTRQCRTVASVDANKRRKSWHACQDPKFFLVAVVDWLSRSTQPLIVCQPLVCQSLILTLRFCNKCIQYNVPSLNCVVKHRQQETIWRLLEKVTAKTTRVIYNCRGTQRGYSSKPLNKALLNVFQYLNGRYRHIFIP